MLAKWALLALPALLAAQTKERNPFSSPQDLTDGKRYYRFYCVNCHGMDGASGRGARLAVKNHRVGNDDRVLYQTIANGITGSEMPGHWLDEDTIWKILLYMRSLEGGAVTEGCSLTPGDAARGEQLFRQSGCIACHSLRRGERMEGTGRMGPDLSTMGATRSRTHLRGALADPSKEVSAKYKTVRVQPKGGARVEGILLSEDGYTIHLIDRQEQIRSFAKSEATVERIKSSLMPAYTQWNEEQWNNMLSFLCSCRGGGQ